MNSNTRNSNKNRNSYSQSSQSIVASSGSKKKVAIPSENKKKEAVPSENKKKEAPSSGSKKTIKEKISSAIKNVKDYIKKKKNPNKYEAAIIEQDAEELSILEEKMNDIVDKIHIVETGKNKENEFEIENNKKELLADIFNNLSKDLNKLIQNTEAIFAISKTNDQQQQQQEQQQHQSNSILLQQSNKPGNNSGNKPGNNSGNKSRSNRDNLDMLNKILHCLANNYIDSKSNQELSFTPSIDTKQSKYTIKVISLRYKIEYSTFREFVDKIAVRLGTVLALCKWISCPKDVINEIEEFSKVYKSKKDIEDDIYYNLLKNIIIKFLEYEKNNGRMYLDKKTQQRTQQLPDDLSKLLETQAKGGKKRRGKNIKKNKIRKKYFH